MSFKQWLWHVRAWFWHVRQFPLPREEHHFWTKRVGQRMEWCLTCDAEREDPDWDEETAAHEMKISNAWDRVLEEEFPPEGGQSTN